MKDSQRDFLIGLCAIVATAALIALLVLFGEIKTTPGWSFKVLTRNAVGLRVGSQITVNGVLAGQVSDVQLIADPEYPVELTLNLEQKIQVPKNVTFMVRDSLLGNSGLLALVTTGWSPDMPMIESDDVIQENRIASVMMTELGQEIDRRMGGLFESFTTIGQQITVLLNDDVTDDRTLTSVLRNANQLLQSTNAWVDSSSLRENAEQFLKRMPAMADRAIGGLESVTTLARKLDTRSDQLGLEMAETARQLRQFMDASTRLLDAMREGDGTIGQLVKNPDLYNSMEAATSRLDQILVDIQLMVEQIREEGAGVHLF